MKRQIKRVIAGVLAVATLFLATPISDISTSPLALKSAYTASALSDEELTYGDLTYVIIDGGISITGCDESATDVVIPSEIDGLPVTAIGNRAFFVSEKLTTISIPNSITSIGWEAFLGCDKLTSITIPESVTSIEEDVFIGCESLTSILVNENNQYYSDIDGVLLNKDKTALISYPLGNTSDKYEIPNSVTLISDSAFYMCINLTSIVIPDSVTKINSYAFCGCYSIEFIVIPNSVVTIQEGAFSYCNGLSEVTLPDTITSIESLAFNECRRLTSITIPTSVTSIGENAFDSKHLKTIYGYTGSAAETYANEKEITFVALDGKFAIGDLSGDSVLDSGDITFIKQAIYGKQTLSPNQAKAADINGDGKLDVFDLVLLKRNILN